MKLTRNITFASQTQLKNHKLQKKKENQREVHTLSYFYFYFICFSWSCMLGDSAIQWGSQLSEGPVSWSCVDQSQDRKGTRCCCHQTDGPNGPCSLWRKKQLMRKRAKDHSGTLTFLLCFWTIKAIITLLTHTQLWNVYISVGGGHK